MKLVIAFSALAAFATAQDYCAGNCESDESFGRNDCHCDEACVDLVDCCDDYEEACVDDRRSGDETCRGCPEGPQTTSSGRGTCYCDAACVGASDCCEGYEEQCGDLNMDTAVRANYCDHLDISKAAFCDVDLKVGTFFPVKIVETGDEDDGENGYMLRWAQDSFDATCLDNPEVTGGAHTCYGTGYSYTYTEHSNLDQTTDVYWRFGISGLSVYKNFCYDDDECNECDDTWLRTGFGVAYDPNFAWDNLYGYDYHLQRGRYQAAIPGVCNVVFNFACGDGEDDSDCSPDGTVEERTKLIGYGGVFGSGTQSYDIDPAKIRIYDPEYTNALTPSAYGMSNNAMYSYLAPHISPKELNEEEDHRWDRSDLFSSWNPDNAVVWHLTDVEYMAHKIAAETTAMKWQGWMTQNFENEEEYDWSHYLQFYQD